MSIVTTDLFASYMSQEDLDVVLLQQVLDSAEGIVKDYLTYNPAVASYDLYFDGNKNVPVSAYQPATNRLSLGVQPINSITTFTIDGVAIDPSAYIIRGEDIILKSTTFTSGLNNVHVVFNAGYTVVPAVIVQTIMQIAGLLLAETNGNIGITSKTMDGGMTRQFVRTTNFDPYLQKLNYYRIIRF